MTLIIIKSIVNGLVVGAAYCLGRWVERKKCWNAIEPLVKETISRSFAEGYFSGRKDEAAKEDNHFQSIKQLR